MRRITLYRDDSTTQVVYERVKHIFWTAGNTVLVVAQYTKDSDTDHYYIHWPRAALNERLARAIYPDADIVARPDGSVDAYIGPQPSGTGWRNFDFTRDAAASRELVLRVAAQEDDAWIYFSNQLSRLLPIDFYDEHPLEVIKAVMTSDPLLIAQAADAAIGGKDER